MVFRYCLQQHTIHAAEFKEEASIYRVRAADTTHSEVSLFLTLDSCLSWNVTKKVAFFFHLEKKQFNLVLKIYFKNYNSIIIIIVLYYYK